MPANIEIKAYARDWTHLQRVAGQLSDTPPRMIDQEDVFFHVPAGRLKLRIFSPTAGELIHYDRPDQLGPKQSRYQITPVADPASLRQTLTAALGIRGTVRKRRQLYLVGQTRIHLDEVDDLGRFIELEVVMQPHQSIDVGHRIAADLMSRLGILPEDLIDKAYIDMLKQ